MVSGNGTLTIPTTGVISKPVPVDQRDQHRGRAQRSARRRHPWVEIVITAGRFPQGGGFGRVSRPTKPSASRAPELQETFDYPVLCKGICRCQ